MMKEALHVFRHGRKATVAMLLVAALGLAGCSSGGQPAAKPASGSGQAQGAAASGSAPQPGGPAQPLKIRLGIMSILDSVTPYVAEKQGFFKEEGLQVEVRYFDTGPQAISAIISGDLQITYSALVPIVNAMARKAPIVIIANNAVTSGKTPDGHSLLVRADSGINTLKDLEGKRIATNGLGSMTQVYPLELMARQGVDTKKITWAEVPFPQLNDVLLKGQVDAIAQVEPFTSMLVDSGKVKELAYPLVEVRPNVAVTQFVASRKWAEENPDAVKRFVRALDKAVRYLQANDAAARTLIAEFTGLKPEVVRTARLWQWSVYPIDMASLQSTVDLMAKWKSISESFDIKPFIFKTALGDLK